jgi:hypothetical protein
MAARQAILARLDWQAIRIARASLDRMTEANAAMAAILKLSAGHFRPDLLGA